MAPKSSKASARAKKTRSAAVAAASADPPPLRRSTRASVPPERWAPPTVAPGRVSQRRPRAPKPAPALSPPRPPSVTAAAKPRGVARRRRTRKVPATARTSSPPQIPAPRVAAVAPETAFAGLPAATSPVGTLMSLVAGGMSSPAASSAAATAAPTPNTAISPPSAKGLSPSIPREALSAPHPPTTVASPSDPSLSPSGLLCSTPATSLPPSSAFVASATGPNEGYINHERARAARILADGRRRRHGGPLGHYISRLVYNLTAQLSACTARFRLDETVDAQGNPAPQIFPEGSGASQIVVYLQEGDTTVDVFLGRPKEVTVTFGKPGGELQMVGVAAAASEYVEVEDEMEW